MLTTIRSCVTPCSLGSKGDRVPYSKARCSSSQDGMDGLGQAGQMGLYDTKAIKDIKHPQAYNLSQVNTKRSRARISRESEEKSKEGISPPLTHFKPKSHLLRGAISRFGQLRRSLKLSKVNTDKGCRHERLSGDDPCSGNSQVLYPGDGGSEVAASRARPVWSSWQDGETGSGSSTDSGVVLTYDREQDVSV